MKLWGGRFETGPSEVFERFSNSLHFDRRLLDADVRGFQKRCDQFLGQMIGKIGEEVGHHFHLILLATRQSDDNVSGVVYRKVNSLQ